MRDRELLEFNSGSVQRPSSLEKPRRTDDSRHISLHTRPEERKRSSGSIEIRKEKPVLGQEPPSKGSRRFLFIPIQNEQAHPTHNKNVELGEFRE